MRIDVSKLSIEYEARLLGPDDADEVYSMLLTQPLYFRSIGAEPSLGSVVGDMTVLPPGCDPKQKHFVGFFDNGLAAVMDLIAGYPDETACYIGFFAVRAERSGSGYGSKILAGVLDELKRSGYAKVRLAYSPANPRAVRFWTKNGFVPIYETKHSEYGKMLVAERFLDMEKYRIISLRDLPGIENRAAEWFSSKWGVPKEAYLECMDAFLSGETEYGWFLCLFGNEIVGGLGVIENDFHDRKDLYPNICAVYTEEAHRNKGIAGKLLNSAVEEMRKAGVSPVYLVTDHTGFYERYGWEFFCYAQGDGEPDLTRLYIHR